MLLLSAHCGSHALSNSGTTGELCRLRKSKCSGERPSCTVCRRKGLGCVYKTLQDETRTEALKRQNEALADEVDELRTAAEFLRTGTEQETAEVVRRLKEGQGLSDAIREISEGALLLAPTRPRSSRPSSSSKAGPILPWSPRTEQSEEGSEEHGMDGIDGVDGMDETTSEAIISSQQRLRSPSGRILPPLLPATARSLPGRHAPDVTTLAPTPLASSSSSSLSKRRQSSPGPAGDNLDAQFDRKLISGLLETLRFGNTTQIEQVISVIKSDMNFDEISTHIFEIHASIRATF